jgi:hypothetical protein
MENQREEFEGSSSSSSSSSIYANGISKFSDHLFLEKLYNETKSRWISDPRSKLQLSALSNIEKAMDITADDVSEDPEKQMIQFVSGAGGTGKSELIKMTRNLAKFKLGKTIGMYGPFLALSPTGSSANGIGGFTYQSVCKTRLLNSKCGKPNFFVSKANGRKMGSNFRGTHMFWIDEVSCMSCDDFHKVSVSLQAARLYMDTTSLAEKERNVKLSKLPFGGFHVNLSGDFYQLPPVSGFALYTPVHKKFTDAGRLGLLLWKKLNVFIELIENFRFAEGPDCLLAKLLVGARVGKPNLDLLCELNGQRTVLSVAQAEARCHKDALWLAPTKELVQEHNDRGSKHLQEARPRPLVYRSVAKHHAYNEVSEGQTTVSRNVAVQLCKCKEVYVGKSHNKEELPPIEIEYVVGGRVRVADNDGTQLGIYNGAMGTIYSFGCKDSRMTYHSLNPTNESIVDLSISSRDGIIIFVQMDKMALSNKLNKNGERLEYSCCDVVERLVPFAMKPSCVIINLPGIGKYRRFQYPLLPAQACTIHKSQGMTAHNGLVLHMKNIKFEMGLAYVGLSRAKNLADIYLITMLHASLFTSHASKREQVHAEYDRLRSEVKCYF